MEILLISEKRVTQEYRQYTTGDYTINHANYINLSIKNFNYVIALVLVLLKLFPIF